MFDVLGMVGNYEDRMVARFAEGDLFVSTARVSDSTQPFETAIGHPNYNEAKLVIVEQYDTRDEAMAGHERWLAEMTADVLPTSLRDVSECGLAQMCDLGEEDWRERSSNKAD